MRVHPVMAAALAPFMPNGRHYRSARIRAGAIVPAGFRPGDLVNVRWSGMDGRGRDLYVISHTNSFSGYSPIFCAHLLNDFSTCEVIHA